MMVRMLRLVASSASVAGAGAGADAGAPASPVRKSSKFVADGATSFACAPVVVKPMTRPANTMATHNVSDKLAVSLPMPGAAGAFSQRVTLRPALR